MSRTDLVQKLVACCGPSMCTIENIGDGWPSTLCVRAGADQVHVTVHASRIGTHSRRENEMRFQNPADRKAVSSNHGCLPLLVGLTQDDDLQPVLVVVDGSSRLGRQTRFSILFDRRIIAEARGQGWSSYTSSTGERMVAIQPALFPLAVAELTSGIVFSTSDINILATTSRLHDNEKTEASLERLRRSTTALVRDYRFGKDVVGAYSGLCAMCGLDFGLVVGAHIYPASAPDSQDKVWNGLCLCQNHHAAFDRYYIWVDPTPDHELIFHPKIIENASSNRATKNFLESTADQLSIPTDEGEKPRSEMFQKRYEYYREEYSWRLTTPV